MKIDRNKVVIAVLVLFAVLYLVGAGAGLSQDEGADQDRVQTWQARLDGLVGSLLSEPLEPKDLSVRSPASLCRLEAKDADVTEVWILRAGQTPCELRVAAAEARVRKLRVVIVGGGPVNLRFRSFPDTENNEPRPAPAEETLTAGKPVVISAFSEGGTLRLICTAPSRQRPACRVRLGPVT